MQSSKAAQLRRAWEAKGNPLCDHLRVEREYDLGADTGDEVCTTCGATAHCGTLRVSSVTDSGRADNPTERNNQ